MLKKIKEFCSKHKYKILSGISLIAAGYYFYCYLTDDTRIKLSIFFDALKNNQINQVIVKGDTIYFKSQFSDWYNASIVGYPKNQLFQFLKATKNLSYSCQQAADTNSITMLASLIAVAVPSFIMLKSMDKNKEFIKKPQIKDALCKFQDYYGGDIIKNKFKEIIDYVKNAHKYQQMGARIRKGILLYGPPGTGKTMLARALATQAQLGFIGTCASQFQQIYIGVGPKRIRQMFASAREMKDGCIIFIDELDAIGSRHAGLAPTRQSGLTINQLLTQMDGFETNKNIIVIGATNRIDLIDPAILRSGRFDIKYQLQLPDIVERQGILKTILKRNKVPNNLEDHYLRKIVQDMQHWSGADIEAFINQSIYSAMRRQDTQVKNQDFQVALRQFKNYVN